jgi:hypothetical protein
VATKSRLKGAWALEGSRRLKEATITDLQDGIDSLEEVLKMQIECFLQKNASVEHGDLICIVVGSNQNYTRRIAKAVAGTCYRLESILLGKEYAQLVYY